MNVLIVEDDEILSDLMKCLLESQGFNVYVSFCVEKAYFYLDKIDVVIVDSYKGREFKFADYCKHKGMHVIYHTGRMDVTDEEHYKFDCVIQKPGFGFLVKYLNSLFNRIELCV